MPFADLPVIGTGMSLVGVLVWLLVRLSNQSSTNWKGYQEVIGQVREQHRQEVDRLVKQHQAEENDLRSEVETLKLRGRHLEDENSDLRHQLWLAENQVARLSREIPPQRPPQLPSSTLGGGERGD